MSWCKESPIAAILGASGVPAAGQGSLDDACWDRRHGKDHKEAAAAISLRKPIRAENPSIVGNSKLHSSP